MLFKPAQLGLAKLGAAELEADKKACKKIGPCGVGKKALYLNSFYIDRRYYLPYGSISRVFKRVAMSQGGFTGKGMFASMAYLVVEYDGGKQKQCNFKDERDVDALLEVLAKEQPQIKRLSAAGEQVLEKKEAEKAARKLPELTKDAEHSLTVLRRAKEYLEAKPEISDELSAAERRKRAQLQSKPVYRYVALVIFLFGLVAAAYGLYAITNHVGNYGIYFALFGFAAIFLFQLQHAAHRPQQPQRHHEASRPGRAGRSRLCEALPERCVPGAELLRTPDRPQADDGRHRRGPRRHRAGGAGGRQGPPEGAERRRSGRAGGVRRGRPHQGDVPEPPIRIREPTKAPRFRGAFVVPNFLHCAEGRFIMRTESRFENTRRS